MKLSAVLLAAVFTAVASGLAYGQPFPSKPPAFDLQGITENDLIDFTPELRAEAIKAVQGYTLGPIYTPPTLVSPTNKGTIQVPGLGGGANWPGGASVVQGRAGNSGSASSG